MPKLTAKIFDQKWYSERQVGFFVFNHKPSSTAR
ncbi:Uncharacterised protein [Klebsiella pneumoniae]|nr:Uncharacterised protein [Klebsiella pneumoniae]